MPLRRGNRYITFLVFSALVVCAIAMRASANKEGMGAILVGIGLLIRQEYSDRRARQSRHKINGKLDETTGKLDDIKTAADVVKEHAATVVRQTNGELDAKIIRTVGTALEQHVPDAVAKALSPLVVQIKDIDAEMHKIKHSVANLLAVKNLNEAEKSLPPKVQT